MTETETLARAQEIEDLLDALDTCHICHGTLHLEDVEPTHCEDCSGDCDAHDEPACEPIWQLHAKARQALKVLTAELRKESERAVVVRCHSCGGTVMHKSENGEIHVYHDCCSKYGKYDNAHLRRAEDAEALCVVKDAEIARLREELETTKLRAESAESGWAHARGDHAEGFRIAAAALRRLAEAHKSVNGPCMGADDACPCPQCEAGRIGE